MRNFQLLSFFETGIDCRPYKVICNLVFIEDTAPSLAFMTVWAVGMSPCKFSHLLRLLLKTKTMTTSPKTTAFEPRPKIHKLFSGILSYKN